jgi:hypothetical protein
VLVVGVNVRGRHVRQKVLDELPEAAAHNVKRDFVRHAMLVEGGEVLIHNGAALRAVLHDLDHSRQAQCDSRERVPQLLVVLDFAADDLLRQSLHLCASERFTHNYVQQIVPGNCSVKIRHNEHGVTV